MNRMPDSSSSVDDSFDVELFEQVAFIKKKSKSLQV